MGMQHQFIPFGETLVRMTALPFRCAATKAFKKLVTDKAEVDGLPQSALAMAAQQAAADSKDGDEAAKPTAEEGPWLFTLDAPSFMPVQSHAKNRCTPIIEITIPALGSKCYLCHGSPPFQGSRTECTKLGEIPIVCLRFTRQTFWNPSSSQSVTMCPQPAFTCSLQVVDPKLFDRFRACCSLVPDSCILAWCGAGHLGRSCTGPSSPAHLMVTLTTRPSSHR